MKRGVGIVLALPVAAVILVGLAGPRDTSTVTPASVSSAVAVKTCAVAHFSHKGYPSGTNANEIIYDNNAVLSDSYRRVGPKPTEVTVPLALIPGPHTLRLKVEVAGEVTYLSDEIVVDCP